MYFSEATWIPRIVEVAPVAVLALDESGRVVETNNGGRRLFAAQDKDITGFAWSQLSPLLSQPLRVSLGRLLRGESQSEVGEAEINGACLCYNAGWIQHPQHMIFVILTPRPGSGADESANFLSLAAHELKTPLTAIKGGAQLLERRLVRNNGLLTEREAQLLSMISGQVNRLTAIIDDLLEASRLSAGRVRLTTGPNDLGELLREVVEEVGGESRIEYDVRAEPAHAVCDRKRVKQVVEQLLRNAASRCDSGGSITITLERNRDGDPCIGVHDPCAGITPEEQSHVFERFYKGAQGEKGLGLGLYIASELVRLHGGHIWLQSDEGSGSTFYFTLPAA